MYAHDNNDVLLGPMSNPGWCDGLYDQTPDGITNRTLAKSPTYKYVNNPSAFRCAADRSTLRYGSAILPRVISFSANAFMGPPSGWVQPANSLLKSMKKASDLTTPGPAGIYVLLDEHENSINDSHFFPFNDMSRYSRNKWLDAPSGRHGNAGGFVFADGHSEIRRWKTRGLSTVLSPVSGSTPRPYPDLPFIGTSDLADFIWMTNHIAAFRN
jgi:prepilin-type processing-associated H-X9-DG protein